MFSRYLLLFSCIFRGYSYIFRGYSQKGMLKRLVFISLLFAIRRELVKHRLAQERVTAHLLTLHLHARRHGPARPARPYIYIYYQGCRNRLLQKLQTEIWSASKGCSTGTKHSVPASTWFRNPLSCSCEAGSTTRVPIVIEIM